MVDADNVNDGDVEWVGVSSDEVARLIGLRLTRMLARLPDTNPTPRATHTNPNEISADIRDWITDHTTPKPVSPPRECPDGARCMWKCAGSACHRVTNYEPLDGVYTNDDWPTWIREMME